MLTFDAWNFEGESKLGQSQVTHLLILNGVGQIQFCAEALAVQKHFRVWLHR